MGSLVCLLLKRSCQLWFLLLFCGLCGQWLRAEEASGAGWSQDLLDRLISVPVVAESAGSPPQIRDGFVLRSYQLRNLHLGDPGPGTNVVNILRRMLPPESQVTEDRPGNTLHVLTDRAAQDAVLELISAMDGREERAATPIPESASVPADVRQALVTLASTQPDSQRLIKLIEDSSQRLESRVGDTLRLSEAEARADMRRTLLRFGSTSGCILAMVALLGWLGSRRSRQKDEMRRREQERSIALVPAQGIEMLTVSAREQQQRSLELQKLMESFSIAYQADRQRGAVVLEAVAQKHREISSTLEEVQHWRKEMSESAGRVFIDVNRAAIEQIIDQASRTLANRAEQVGLLAETAARKMEETAGRLEVQHAKAEALASELERTQREVDSLFEKLRDSQEQARKAEFAAEEQRKIAYEKAAALAKKEAALAGLSLLMQEPIEEILETVNGGAVPLAETVPFTAVPDDYTQRLRQEPFPNVGSENGVEMLVAEPAVADSDAGQSEAMHKKDQCSEAASDPLMNSETEESVCSTRPLTFRILPFP